MNLKKLLSSKAAFTMVEMIVVMTIFSVIGVGIATSFISGMELWGRARNEDFVKNNALLTLEKIIRELQQIVSVSEVELTIDTSSLMFASLSGARVVKIKYRFDDLGKVLLRATEQVKDIGEESQEELQEDLQEQELLFADNVFFSCFVFEQEKEVYSWVDTWPQEAAKLIAIKLNVKIEDDEIEKTIFIPEL